MSYSSILRIAIAGDAYVGKSYLLNRLAGDDVFDEEYK